MRILFDTGHPSFVHLFKGTAQQLIDEGHSVLFSTRDKDHLEVLLEELGMPFKTTGWHYSKAFGKVWGLFKNSFNLLRLIRKFKPDCIISGASPFASVASFFSGSIHFVFDDTENREQILFFKFGSTLILTPDAFRLNLGRNHVKYPGIHELAYLPDQAIKNEKRSDSPLVFFRFVAWEASHDFFRHGLSMQQKIELVNHFEKKGKVVISSESKLPDCLLRFEYKGKLSEIHNVLGRSSLYIGESATMAAEAVCLNVPAVYIDFAGRSYTDMLQKDYGLMINLKKGNISVESVISSAEKLLIAQSNKLSYKQFLKDSIHTDNLVYWLAINCNKPELLTQLHTKDFFNTFKTL